MDPIKFNDFVIHFNGEMVRAILDGRKTQTRRPVKYPALDPNGDYTLFCPYGQLGCRLLVWYRDTRIMLEITDIRVERVQDISHQDALAEGVEFYQDAEEFCDTSPIAKFHRLWDSIYASKGYGWDANPWVWTIEFERILK